MDEGQDYQPEALRPRRFPDRQLEYFKPVDNIRLLIEQLETERQRGEHLPPQPGWIRDYWPEGSSTRHVDVQFYDPPWHFGGPGRPVEFPDYPDRMPKRYPPHYPTDHS